ncbi:hypothetical protein GCM10027615_36660 [Plantactinospora veratri]
MAGLRKVQVTFDGFREHHDAVRVTHGGHSTFDQIVNNIAQASEVTHLRWNFRVNATRENMGAVPNLISVLSERVDTSRATINFAPVEDVGIGYETSLTYDQSLVETFVSWNALAMSKGFSVPFYRPLRACTYCSEISGTTGAVINADGTLYSCWESVGKPGYEVGNVATGYLPRQIIEPRWVACSYDVLDKGSTMDVSAFADEIDTARLDWLYEHGSSRPLADK